MKITERLSRYSSPGSGANTTWMIISLKSSLIFVTLLCPPAHLWFPCSQSILQVLVVEVPYCGAHTHYFGQMSEDRLFLLCSLVFTTKIMIISSHVHVRISIPFTSQSLLPDDRFILQFIQETMRLLILEDVIGMCKLQNIYVVVLLFSAQSIRCKIRGRYTRGPEGEIVVPKKVSKTGDFVSYYLPHFYNKARVRRGADTGKVHYVVPIEGSVRMLELLPAEDFHGPGLVIEHHENDARLSGRAVKFRKPRKLNCYYHGWVRDEPLSSAAVSTCSGLAGAISIGSYHYLIEPVEEEEGGSPTVRPEHKHILFKRDHQRGIHNRSLCGTKDTFASAFGERMKWEEKFGKETEKMMMDDDDVHTQAFVHHNIRSKKWCTTCKPKQYLKCQSPHPPCKVERPLFLELAIVIGPRVASDKYLLQDMEQYINTIINIAAKHFQDSSLERPILIKLVRVITLGYLYEDLDSHRYEPEELLRRFCAWQTHFNPPKEVHPNHHDYVLYLVKFGDCCGNMQGLTNMASVCRPDKACGIVSPEGLFTGHVITHMIGHSMGADHDDENVSGCLPEEPDGTCYHMGEHICTRSTTWSICSRQCISKFTSTHAAWCMSDVPTAHDLTDPILLPGQVYSAAEQCRINFEMDTYACLVGEFCKHLFCKINDDECVSTGEPPAQGTRCGPDQWCFNQRCVHRGSRPGATNGEWGMWSQWTQCSKTCGGGVQTANRACDSPAPSNGGRKCPGAWLKSRMCNIGACPDGGKGFLDQQCKSTNSRLYHGRRHGWLFFNQQIEDLHCVVMCINEESEVAVRAPLAIDGTFCKPGSKDVCIRGMCRPVGCDWVIGSKAKEDACGVCRGNGTECRVMQGYFAEQNFQGIMPFLKLPIGTSMVLMRETRPSPCFFVIVNSLNSTYYLNGDTAEDRTLYAGAFMIQSTLGIYQLKANMERIFIKEPLKVPITVSVVCRNSERAIGILYQYALPESFNPDMKPHYTWEFLSWEKCPHSCGGAIQRATPVCVEAQGGEVEDSYCSQDSKPLDRIRVCNPRPCKAKWWVGPWSECDCYMKEGIKTRMVMCAHLKAARSYYITIVKEEECLGEDKPFSEKPCDKDAEILFWIKKGERKKRDYMDLVPYSKEVENYSVWDENVNISLGMLNVREIFHKVDPENVEDYVYLKKIGMTPAILGKFLGNEQNSNGRVRRRKAIVQGDETKLPSSKERVIERVSTAAGKMKNGAMGGKQNLVEPHKLNRDVEECKKESENKISNFRDEEVQKKPIIKNVHEKVDKGVEPPQTKAASAKIYGRSTTFYISESSSKYFLKKSTEMNKTELLAEKGLTTNSLKQDPFKRSSTSVVGVKDEETHATTNEALKSMIHDQKSSNHTGGNYENVTSKIMQDSQTIRRLEDVTIINYFSSEKKETGSTLKSLVKPGKIPVLSSTEPVIDGESEQITRQPNRPFTRYSSPAHTDEHVSGSESNEKLRKYVVIVDEPPVTEAVLIGSDKARIQQQTNGVTGVDRMPATSLLGKLSTMNPSTSLTVPLVKIAPGLTPYPMDEVRSHSRSGACWKVEMKHPRLQPTCDPVKPAVVQPADDSPEWDFVNTSNVKIFVVPIQSTIRTIIQNDNEYILIETLAKFPMADEMNMVEHRGGSARRKLKIAADRKASTSSQIED